MPRSGRGRQCFDVGNGARSMHSVCAVSFRYLSLWIDRVTEGLVCNWRRKNLERKWDVAEIFVISLIYFYQWVYHNYFFTYNSVRTITVMCILETSLSGCYRRLHGIVWWTAGQRIDPSSNSAFVWRTSNTYTTVSGMTYNNWDSGEPNYVNQRQSCMCLYRGYKWHDADCSAAMCSVCELDIHQ